jgi:hypothetical protein
MTETGATDALVKINDKDRRILLTDNFLQNAQLTP